MKIGCCAKEHETAYGFKIKLHERRRPSKDETVCTINHWELGRKKGWEQIVKNAVMVDMERQA